MLSPRDHSFMKFGLILAWMLWSSVLPSLPFPLLIAFAAILVRLLHCPRVVGRRKTVVT